MTRYPTDAEVVEMVNDYHVARAAVGDAKHARMVWTAEWFHKNHPDVSISRAYKELDRALR